MLISGVLGKSVLEQSGDVIGRLGDLVARLDDDSRPVVTGIVVRVARKRDLFVSAAEVADFAESGIRLTSSRLDVRPFARRDGEVLLRRDLLDREIVDLTRGRLARVNDLVLGSDGDGWRVVAVDFGANALVNRLGLGWLARKRLTDRQVPWEQVDIFASDAPVRLPGIRHGKLARLHPSDLAHIVDELPYPQGDEVVASLDDARAADAVEEMDPRIQAVLLTSMDQERAADILEEMGDAAAADVLADLDPDRAEELLQKMDAEDAAAVRNLLTYDESSAGGIMTTELVAMSSDVTVAAALEQLRLAEWLPESFDAIYVVNSTADGDFLGVTTLGALVAAGPEAPIGTLAKQSPTATPYEDAREVAQRLVRYRLSAMPVVEVSGTLLGIITIADAVELLLPEEPKLHIPRIFG